MRDREEEEEGAAARIDDDGYDSERGLAGDARRGRKKEGKEGKDGPGPVMVSDTLCPAVHILGT